MAERFASEHAGACRISAAGMNADAELSFTLDR
jgi:hypothetical protein